MEELRHMYHTADRQCAVPVGIVETIAHTLNH